MFTDLAKLFAPSDYLTFDKDWNDFRLYAIGRHGSQMYGDRPYAYHLAMVETVLHEYGFTEYQYQASAWLHDIVEDTGTTFNHINERFGPLVTALVFSVTGEGKNRKERTASIYEKLKKYPDGAVLKVADRIANMSNCRREYIRGVADSRLLQMYVNEWDEFRTNIGPLMGNQLRARIIWEALDSLVEACKEDIRTMKKGEEISQEIEEEQKKGEAAVNNPSQV